MYCRGIGGLWQFYYCDWNNQVYRTLQDCYSQCSTLLISRSEFNFIVLLAFSIFVVLLVSIFIKVAVD